MGGCVWVGVKVQFPDVYNPANNRDIIYMVPHPPISSVGISHWQECPSSLSCTLSVHTGLVVILFNTDPLALSPYGKFHGSTLASWEWNSPSSVLLEYVVYTSLIPVSTFCFKKYILDSGFITMKLLIIKDYLLKMKMEKNIFLLQILQDIIDRQRKTMI